MTERQCIFCDDVKHRKAPLHAAHGVCASAVRLAAAHLERQMQLAQCYRKLTQSTEANASHSASGNASEVQWAAKCAAIKKARCGCGGLFA